MKQLAVTPLKAGAQGHKKILCLERFCTLASLLTKPLFTVFFSYMCRQIVRASVALDEMEDKVSAKLEKQIRRKRKLYFVPETSRRAHMHVSMYCVVNSGTMFFRQQGHLPEVPTAFLYFLFSFTSPSKSRYLTHTSARRVRLIGSVLLCSAMSRNTLCSKKVRDESFINPLKVLYTVAPLGS